MEVGGKGMRGEVGGKGMEVGYMGAVRRKYEVGSRSHHLRSKGPRRVEQGWDVAAGV